MSSVYVKTACRELQGHNFIKMLVHHSLSSENIMFKTASFRYVFQRESAKKSIYSRAAICTLEAFNFTERNSIIDIFYKNRRIFCQQFFFVTSFLSIFIKSSSSLHKSQMWSLGRGATHLFFYTEYPYTKHLLEKNQKTELCT